jgi:D-alanyl-D-alanine dipeptidase
MRQKIVVLATVLAAMAAAGLFWQISSPSYATTAMADDDPTFAVARATITRLLAARNYHEALRQTGTTILSVLKKPSQPSLFKHSQLMDLTDLAAQAYTGLGKAERTLISHQQIIYLYPLHAFSSPKEQSGWNQANALALKAIQQLVHDYRTVNQVAAGIAYFQQLQKQYAHTPLAQAARDAEQRLRSGK